MRNFGLAFNDWFEKWMFLLVPGSLAAGYLMSDQLAGYTEAVPYLFAFVTLTMAIGCGLEQLRGVMRKPGILAAALLLAHGLTPLAAYGLGALAFGADSPYVVGLVLFALIPLGVSSVLWVGMSGGGVPLILAMVVLDSLLSPLVVPAGVQLFFGSAIEMEAGPLMLDLTILIVLPTVIGVALHEWSRGRLQGWVKPYAAPVSKLCFASVVALNAAAIAPHVHTLKSDMLLLVPVSVLLVAVCYAVGFVGFAGRGDWRLQVTASYATGMRNISLGIVLALGYFSPLAAVPVVLSILIQQPAATLHHYVLQKLNRSKAGDSAQTHVR